MANVLPGQLGEHIPALIPGQIKTHLAYNAMLTPCAHCIRLSTMDAKHWVTNSTLKPHLNSDIKGKLIWKVGFDVSSSWSMIHDDYSHMLYTWCKLLFWVRTANMLTSGCLLLMDTKGHCIQNPKFVRAFFSFFRIPILFLSKCVLRMQKRRKSNLIRIFLWRTNVSVQWPWVLVSDVPFLAQVSTNT